LINLLQEAGGSVLSGKAPPPELVKALVSKGLGYGILAGACITKLPQIGNVLRAGSAAGLSALSTELEVVGLSIHTAYGALNDLPFSAYGEASILCAQSIFLLALIYKWSKAPLPRVLAMIALLGSFGAGLVTGHIGRDIIRVAFDANNLVFMAARVPQIISNFRAKATGQLSLVTCGINVVGCVVRIYTSLAENAGAAMVRQYAISLALNAALVLQILLYAKNTKAQAAKTAKKKKQ